MDRNVAIGLTVFSLLFLIGSYLIGRRTFRKRTKPIVVTREIPGAVPSYTEPEVIEVADAQQYSQFGCPHLIPNNTKPKASLAHVHEKRSK